MSNFSIDPAIKACKDGTYKYVPVDRPKLKPKTTAIGQAEEINSILCAIDFAPCDSRDNTVIIPRCEEIYAEDWRET